MRGIGLQRGQSGGAMGLLPLTTHVGRVRHMVQAGHRSGQAGVAPVRIRAQTGAQVRVARWHKPWQAGRGSGSVPVDAKVRPPKTPSARLERPWFDKPKTACLWSRDFLSRQLTNSRRAVQRTDATPSSKARPFVGLSHLFLVFLRIGLLSFGGPAAQIALMHRVLVEEEGWLLEREFLNALSFCMLLPGPEAMQLATYAGWRLRGVVGGLIAGLLFVLPGAAVIFALAALYVTYGDVPLIDTMFLGVQAAAVVIVFEALVKVSGRALVGREHWVLAALAFVAIYVFSVPFPVIVLCAGIYGALFGARETADVLPHAEKVTWRQTLATILVGLLVWFGPVLLLEQAMDSPFLSDIARFFSTLAVVTFGGAYAVLAYMAQDVVTQFGWLSATEMMDGLGLAETTPGPLILVTQFVGFVAGYHQQGMAMAVVAACVTLWVTFVPCFLWIFAGAPYIDRISAQPRIAAALKAITAVVVGVILNLSVWFALHVVFVEVDKLTLGPAALWWPEFGSFRPAAVLLIGLAAYLLRSRKLGIGWVLAASGVAAVCLSYLGL